MSEEGNKAPVEITRDTTVEPDNTVRDQKVTDATKNAVDAAWDKVVGPEEGEKKDGDTSNETKQPEASEETNEDKTESDKTEHDKGEDEAAYTDETQDAIDKIFEDAEAGEELEEEVTEESNEEVVEGEEVTEEVAETEETESNENTLQVKTADGEVINLPKDAMITIPVDGEMQEISVKDYANRISGERAIAQKFTALDNERKAFEGRLTQYNEGEKEVRDLMGQNKVVEAMSAIFEKAGYNKDAAFAQLFTQITPVLEQYATLDVTGRENWSNELNRKRAEFETKAAQGQVRKLEAEKDQLTRVRSVQATHGLDDATFADMYHRLESDITKGTYQQQTITPELVGQYAQLTQRSDWATDALKGTQLEGHAQAVDHVLIAVNQIAHDGTAVTKEMVNDLVKRAYGDPELKEAQSVNESLKKKGVKPTGKAVRQSQQKRKVVSRKKDGPLQKAKPWYEQAQSELSKGVKLEEMGMNLDIRQNKKRK